MKISCITPSVRPDFLPIVEKCLARQTMGKDKDYEWIVVSPKDWGYGIWVKDPPKKEDDFYCLNKAWNAGLREASGKLFVSIVDGIWFPTETLERLWQHYLRDPMSCIGLVGDQYEGLENDKPEYKVWEDPRKRGDSFYQIPAYDLEFCIASLPMQGVRDVGGFDEQWDKFPAWSEKDLACRMEKLGYKCYIDQSVEYRAIKHERLNAQWDIKYPESTAYFLKCYEEIKNGTRKKLDKFRSRCYKYTKGLNSL